MFVDVIRHEKEHFLGHQLALAKKAAPANATGTAPERHEGHRMLLLEEEEEEQLVIWVCIREQQDHGVSNQECPTRLSGCCGCMMPHEAVGRSCFCCLPQHRPPSESATSRPAGSTTPSSATVTDV